MDVLTQDLAAVWTDARRRLDGAPAGHDLNMATLAVDRHAAGDRAGQTAIRWLGRDDDRIELTYAELADLTDRFASLLGGLGVEPGERVFSLLGRVPELYISALGTLKAGRVFCPLFSAFGPEPVRQRLTLGSGRVLVTTPALYRRKVAPIRDSLPELQHVLLVGPDAEAESIVGGIPLGARLSAQRPGFVPAPTRADDMALLHFTSGTTGAPKGAIHVHEAVVAHYETSRLALDLRPDDVYWCTADPGWVTGTSYGIIAPLTHGATLLVDSQEYDAARWYSTLAAERVNVWYTAPTALRMLMRAGDDLPGAHDLSALRVIASVGEPLNPEVVTWAERVLGLPVFDNWWQTETGGIMIANRAGMKVKPGSMGRPLPGVDAALVRRDPEGEPMVDPDGDAVLVDDPAEEGEIALRRGWPSMFRGYLDAPDRYAKCFAGGWYLSGDLARRDEDGYYWFVGRGDDVIKSAGHLIGPFEVESALLEHPAVAEAGVIGKPDPMVGAIVKAFVALVPGAEPGDALRRELLGFARKRLGPAVAPREIEFVQSVPRTRSGKIMRRLLKARELGLPEGDTSTLEGNS